MTLHTVMPLEAVWEKQGEDAPTTEVRIRGILMEVKPMDYNRVQVVRLLDGPLDSYLDPSYAPGSIIQYAPVS
ncbi:MULTISPECIES: YlzJ-like family protein [Paenibacillus]|uniref:YlzJ-like protein n=1 Tax=Paenibacillus albilobatus TaxID=2716884 RepID=A0A919XE11_9BACL|nr:MULTISPECIES: YlzJ-like family protein [Paenibacillus]GIO29939.1 hypothetical protein J2TS6_10800 [Paenibacillus albilobatus]